MAEGVGVSDEQLDEVDRRIVDTPEWTGGPDWAYWAMADRALLVGEVRASHAREDQARAAAVLANKVGLTAAAERDVLQQRIDKALELHKQTYAGKVDDGSNHFVCEVCEEVSYPCSTATALTGTGEQE